ncbi:EF-hand domain-containing protein [Longispora sp. NPDC051575]|uniref:EF-hand domain-containing protein n=1 Tax=Longispora sp. NPDC051575 TaxID=3154943 RepID=UPI003420C4AD
MEDVLRRKLHRGFGYFDVDGNGRLTESDFAAVTGRLEGAFPDTHPPTLASLHATFMVLWKRYFRPFGRADGSLGPEEFAAAVTGALESDRDTFLRDFGDAASYWMLTADTDGDGVVSRAEFEHMYARTFGLPPDRTAAGFAALDRDGDGVLDTAELLRAAGEFWTSADPDAPGNLMYGPLD